MDKSTSPYTAHSELANILLWTAQILIFGSLCTGAVMKVTMPVPKLAKLFTWTGDVPKPFLRFIGLVDLAGGLGILLPTLTHIHPQLTEFAALGCIVLQLLAIGFHMWRSEIGDTPINFFMLALSVFVLWGR